MHTRGVLIMTPGASMVLTGRAALEASGSVSRRGRGRDRRLRAHHGPERPGAVLRARPRRRLPASSTSTTATPTSCPGEGRPRRGARAPTRSSATSRRSRAARTGPTSARVGEIFDDARQPRPQAAVPDARGDGGAGRPGRRPPRALAPVVGAETAIVWDAHLGGMPVCLIGIESRNVPRDGYRPPDGPEAWSGGTLFPLSSKKVARALNAASGNRPAVVLANLSGFDGSPESMRKLQLEYGAEIARAVVNFDGPDPLRRGVALPRRRLRRLLAGAEPGPRGRGAARALRLGDRRRARGGGRVHARGARAGVRAARACASSGRRSSASRAREARGRLEAALREATARRAVRARRRVRRRPHGGARAGRGVAPRDRRARRAPALRGAGAAPPAILRDSPRTGRRMKRNRKPTFRSKARAMRTGRPAAPGGARPRGHRRHARGRRPRGTHPRRGRGLRAPGRHHRRRSTTSSRISRARPAPRARPSATGALPSRDTAAPR